VRATLCLALLLTGAAGMATEEPPPEALRSDSARFVAVNAEFTLAHEMGHLLIAELDLPLLGREEDAADQLGFISLFLSAGRQRDADFYAKLLDIADYWRLEWQRAKPEHEEVYAWASHGLDAQRFYNLACLIYGSDPDRLGRGAKITGLPGGGGWHGGGPATPGRPSPNFSAGRPPALPGWRPGARRRRWR